MQALQVFAGPRARARLAERGLRPDDVRVVPAAAGGPKGLILGPLDQFIFGDWLARSSQEVHLLGASIGAWRMLTACLGRNAAETTAEFERLAHDYVHQHYDSPAGKMPSAAEVTRGFAAKLDEVFGGREALALSHPRYRPHLFTSRGRYLLAREGRLRTPLGYTGAFMANLLGRRLMGGSLERVVFSPPGAELPMPLHDYRSRQVALTSQNLQAALLASCSIPFWLQAVHDIPGAPRGAYWDGGITDYHLHLNYAAMHLPPGRPKANDAPSGGRSAATLGPVDVDGLVLYPHFQRQVIPGWLDKSLKRRHRSSAFLDNVVLLAPHPDWIKKTLPRGKLPDRADFQHHGDDVPARASDWLRAIAESQRLRDEFAAACEQSTIAALAL